jgi:hypothetical protein
MQEARSGAPTAAVAFAVAGQRISVAYIFKIESSYRIPPNA